MKLKLIKKQPEAKGTVSFFFEASKPVKWLPGQYYYYTLPRLHYVDSRGPTRHFTLSSSPTENAMLRLTTRIREESGYKKSLNEIAIGSEIEGEGPSGTFVLDEEEIGKKHIFLAGGIGITPFRSFIKYNIDKNLKIPMYLLYSNSIPEEIVFRKELESWSQKYDFINLSMTVSHPEESKEKWTGLTGRIDDKMILNLTDKWKLDIKSKKHPGAAVFWLVGPPVFVSGMEDVLEKLGVNSENVRTEKFTGY